MIWAVHSEMTHAHADFDALQAWSWGTGILISAPEAPEVIKYGLKVTISYLEHPEFNFFTSKYD